jgi:hypothetical protein
MRPIHFILFYFLTGSYLNSQIVFDNNLLLDKKGSNYTAFNLKIIGLRKVKKTIDTENLDSLIILKSRKVFNPINRYYIKGSAKEIFFELEPQCHMNYKCDLLVVESNALHLEYEDQNGTKNSIIVKNGDKNNFTVVIKETNFKGETKIFYSTNSFFEKLY